MHIYNVEQRPSFLGSQFALHTVTVNVKIRQGGQKICLMKSCFKNYWLLTLLASFAFSFVGHLQGQTFKVLYSFSPLVNGTNVDGANPGALVLGGDTLYGPCGDGGSNGTGTIFSLNKDGTEFTVLHTFLPLNGSSETDGAYPNSLVVSGSSLYGTAFSGGTNFGGAYRTGTIYSLLTNGSGFVLLHVFLPVQALNQDGTGPGSLVLNANSLYGTTQSYNNQIPSGGGTVFSINSNGAGFSNFYYFGPALAIRNYDGYEPQGITLSGDFLYGTTYDGGGLDTHGTVFSLPANGERFQFKTLHSFSSEATGSYPSGGVLVLGNTLYGTTALGGASSNGIVYSLNLDGSGFTILHSFSVSDGVNPLGTLVSDGIHLFGVTYNTVYQINLDGSHFDLLYTFSAVTPPSTNADGIRPTALVLSANTLYGVASEGGSFGSGTLFSISLPPQLTIVPSSDSVVLTWPADSNGFTLQSSTNLALPVWDTNLPAPVIVNGQYTVTNHISGSQQFFRLSQ